MLPQIFSLDYCYGCGVCAAGCPKSIIDIRLDESGFYRPFITESDACIHCSICDTVCAFINVDDNFDEPKGNFAIWSNNEILRKECSSGGASLEIANLLMSQGYKFCGVRYDTGKNRAEHYIASTPKEALDSIGSKYIQSFTPDALKKIDRKSKNLVVGTPCQIASFRRYIHRYKCEDNFVLMDFFCHSVPSMYLWRFYLHLLENRIGRVECIKWRDKASGWHDSWCIVANDCSGGHSDARNRLKQYRSKYSEGDLFYRLFLGDLCSNEACSKSCIFKRSNSKADIRIGDLWGDTYKRCEEGVSGVIAFTEKGRWIVENLKSCTVEEISNETVYEGQMKRNIRNAEIRNIIIKYLKRGDANERILRSLILLQRVINRIKRTFKFIQLK